MATSQKTIEQVAQKDVRGGSGPPVTNASATVFMERPLIERNAVPAGPLQDTQDRHVPLLRLRGHRSTDREADLARRLLELNKRFAVQARDNTKIINELLAEVPDRELSTRIMTELFNLWAIRGEDSYDNHMARTGHDGAVDSVIRQLVELHNMSFGKDYQETGSSKAKIRIFGPRILEMSCGTGSVIEKLCKSLLPKNGEKITFIGNDLSHNMKAIASEKLAPYMRSIEHRPTSAVGYAISGMMGSVMDMFRSDGHNHQKGNGSFRLIFTDEDIRDMRMRYRINTAILSQTLHLITDPTALVKEKRGATDSNEHKKAKIRVIRDTFDRLPYGGHLILIDEWDPLLTQTGENLGTDLISALFYRTLRPVKDRSIITDIMKHHVPKASFVVELKARIDELHSMYAMVYRKDDRKTITNNGHLPMENAIEDGEFHTTVESARHRAAYRIYKAFSAVDTHFVETYRQASDSMEGWVDFRPLGDSENAGTVLCRADDIYVTRRKFQRAGHAETIVFSQVLQRFDDEGRKKLIGEAIRALKLGGALMFIEEWPPASQNPRPFRNRDFRSMMSDLFEEPMMFEGALRETILPGYDSGMYGYLYRKKEG